MQLRILKSPSKILTICLLIHCKDKDTQESHQHVPSPWFLCLSCILYIKAIVLP